MAQMEFANCMVNIGGDAGNQVPKEGISVAEIAILRALHGEDSVHDIEPLKARSADQRGERERLFSIYGYKPENAEMLKGLFPVAAHIPLLLAELALDESFYKALQRAVPTDAVEPVVEASAPAPAPAEDEADDEFETIQDAHTAPEAKGRRGAKKPAAVKDDIFS